MCLLMSRLLVLRLSILLMAVVGVWAEDDELGEAASLFSGPLEVVATHPEFAWLESPVWSDQGNYLLFSDVQWKDENNITCGMIWRYDQDQGVTKFLPCSGLVGPGDTPENISDYVEGGSNGLHWGWNGAPDLLMCQHGKARIARFSVDDVVNGEIDPTLVTVLTDSYNGTGLNSPNDLVIDGDTLYFTDPPFGRMLFSSGDNRFETAFQDFPQDAIGVYTITGDPGDDDQGNNTPVEPTRILNYGRPDPWQTPNGVAINTNGDIILPITNFSDPRMEVYGHDEQGMLNTTPIMVLKIDIRIEGNNNYFPALTDGVTYSAEHGAIFLSGPGGVHIYDSDTYNVRGFVRIDDLNSNNVVGGGYLWITANKRLLRIPLVSSDDGTLDPSSSPGASPTAIPTSVAYSVPLVGGAICTAMVLLVLSGPQSCILVTSYFL